MLRLLSFCLFIRVCSREFSGEVRAAVYLFVYAVPFRYADGVNIRALKEFD